MSDLTPKMVAALTSATFMESAKGLRYSDVPGVVATGWNIPRSTHAATLRAMVKRGLVMGDGGLTEHGVEVRASHLGMATLTTPSATPRVPVEATQSPVETRNPLVGIKLYDGTFRGLCSMSSVGTYMGEVYGDTTDSMELCANCEETLDRCANLTRYAEEEKQEDVLAESIATMREPYVGVRQHKPGFTAVEHIHAPGCGDIAKEMKRHGQKSADTFDYAASMTLSDIIAANWADVASDEYGNDVMENADAWRDMINWSTDGTSGIRIMACAKDIIGGECVAGEVYRTSTGFPGLKPRTGVVDCADCGEHIMSDDMSIPATCEGGCDVAETFAPEFPTDATVTSAIVPSHAPNGSRFSDSMRTLTEWTAPNDMTPLDALTAMINNNGPDAWSLYTLPNGDTVAANHVRGDVISVYLVSLPVEDTDAAAARGIANLARFVASHTESVEAPTLTTYEVRLSVAVGEGVTIDLGWHTFTVADVTMIPDAYGAANGEWSRPGTPDWASIITVVECYAL